MGVGDLISGLYYCKRNILLSSLLSPKFLHFLWVGNLRLEPEVKLTIPNSEEMIDFCRDKIPNSEEMIEFCRDKISQVFLTNVKKNVKLF